MIHFEVTTQTELDAAIAKATRADLIICRGSGAFEISDSAQVTAYGSAQVTASGSAQVTAYGSAQVTAYGSAQVTAYDSAQVTAYGSAQVRAYGSAQVRASGSAQVTASGSAQVTASGSAQVTASGSAQVTAYDSAQVTAYGSAQVTASGSAQVTAYDSAQVTASRYVAVTRHGHMVGVDGGVLIQIPEIRMAADWLEYHGVPVVDGVAVLYKAVSSEFVSPHGMSYAPGTTPVAPDWDATIECGGGLHFCARPVECLSFYSEAGHRFVACPVRVDEIVVHENAEYPNKVKAPRVVAACYECDIDGVAITQTVPA